jgi:hypothetical protein
MRATETGPLTDAIQLLTVQHRDVERRWSELQAARASGSGDQPSLAADIVRLLATHDAVETMVLYPALRHLGEEGRRLTEVCLDDHHRVRELLSEVDGADITDDGAFSILETCLSAVSQHVAEEEQEVFPLLRRSLSADRVMQLGDELRAAMEVAPTHPHRHMPDSKFGATVAGAMAGIVDRARDARHRPGEG